MQGDSIRWINRQFIGQDGDCQKSIQELQQIEVFLSEFGYLSYGRDFVFFSRHAFSLQMISTSYELTAGSIISCCESGCMADAYSLLRKYRDDLFFYLYVVVCAACSKLDKKSPEVVQWRQILSGGLATALTTYTLELF